MSPDFTRWTSPRWNKDILKDDLVEMLLSGWPGAAIRPIRLSTRHPWRSAVSPTLKESAYIGLTTYR
jgi:hypothetical protein